MDQPASLAELRDRYKTETVRRYVSDLKRYRLVMLEGRGPDAVIMLTEPAILALTRTIRHWMNAFDALDRRFGSIVLLPDRRRPS